MVYSPKYMYSLYAGYKAKGGFKARIQTDTWGPYFLDPANTEKYNGYTFVTKAMIGYDYKNLDFTINADNLFNKKYAIEVKKRSTYNDDGAKTYSPAPTFSMLATVSYKF
ncbi:MAG: TonB-dependent receptor [Spirochaetia bacterium]|nr:TonB-dependent receptor [Spirochaetia bacterium]